MILQPSDGGNALSVIEYNIQCVVLSKWFLHFKRDKRLLTEEEITEDFQTSL